jgi:hypothetical protein
VLAIPEDDGKNSLKFLLLTKTLGCVVLWYNSKHFYKLKQETIPVP